MDARASDSQKTDGHAGNFLLASFRVGTLLHIKVLM